MYCGTRKHYWIGEVQHAYRCMLAQAGRNGTVSRLLAQADTCLTTAVDTAWLAAA